MSFSKPLAVVHYAADVWDHVCPVVRLTGPVEMAGWTLIKGNEWEDGANRIFPERVSQGDLVFIQRDFPRYVNEYQAVVAQARAQGKLLVYEIDDLLTEIPEVHPDVLRYRTARAHILNAVIEADAVTCSSPELSSYLRQFNPNVWVLTNYLNDHLWKIKSKEEQAGSGDDRPLVIGYLGARSHTPDLEMILPVLDSLLGQYDGKILLRLWGIAPPDSWAGRPNVEYLNPCLVNYADFAAYFSQQECDICIAPLLDNQFNRGKSWLKFLEYGTTGAAGVYSRVPPYERVVSHQVNGLLASTPAEWKDCLVELIEDPRLRSRLGQAAQATVLQDWLLSKQIQDWTGVIEKLAASAGHQEKSAREQIITQKFYRWHIDDEDEIYSKAEQIQKLSRETTNQAQRIHALEKISQSTQAQLSAITNSPGWKLLNIVYKIRLMIAPRNSFRERLLLASITSLRILKNEGPRSLLKKLPSLLKAKGVAVAPRVFLAPPPGRCPSPAISVLIIQSGTSQLTPDIESTLKWVRDQTLRDVEVTRWNKELGTAQVIDWKGAFSSGRSWSAIDFAAVCGGLGGRYVCLSSNDLLAQSQTYLEENLIALESESLVFTLNSWGKFDWLVSQLSQGRLPGSLANPLLRQVVRKEYLNSDYSINLAGWAAESISVFGTAGKIIPHTTSQADPASSDPCDGTLDGPELLVRGSYIQVRRTEDLPAVESSPIYPVDAVLPVNVEQSTQPTVFVVMPFLAVGGAEQLALHVLNSLKDKFRFVVLTVDELDPSLGTLTDSFRRLTPWVYNAMDFLNPQQRASFLWYLIERFHPDTLYIANGAPWIYDILPELKRRYPQIRIANQVYDHQAGWINRYDVSMVLNIDAHIGTNQKICQAYRDKGARPEQVHLVEHGIDPTGLNPAAYSPKDKTRIRGKLGLPESGHVVTFASRLHPQKRPLDFLELARRFAFYPDTVFLMAGDGPLAQVLDEQAARMGLKNFYRRPFYRPIQDILAISDVIVLPSEYEGMPLIVAEAQIMGKPVVVTDAGNNREVLAITQGGIVISQIGNVDELVSGVRQMLDTPPDPAHLREALLSHFGIDIISEKYRKVLLGETGA